MWLDPRDYQSYCKWMYQVVQDKYDTTNMTALRTGHSTSNMDFQREVSGLRLTTNEENKTIKTVYYFFHCYNSGNDVSELPTVFIKVILSSVTTVEFSPFQLAC